MAAVRQAGELDIRPMVESDVDAVLAVERSAYEFPWSRQIFVDCLRAGYRCYVGSNDQGIVAHAIVSIVLDEAHLLNLCIGSDHQGQGYGRAMLEFVRRSAIASAVRTLFLEVRCSNIPAIRLYRCAGFRQIGVRPNYYPGVSKREDAVVMRCELTGSVLR